MNEEIKKYVVGERARGVRDDDIRKALLANGWKEADVNNELGNPGAAAPANTGVLVGPGELLSYSTKVFSDKFILIAMIMGVPVICFALAGALRHGIISALLMFAGVILSIFATIGLIKQMRSEWTLSVEDTYRSALPYFWGVVWVSLLTGLATVGGFLLLIIPGIIVSVWVMFARVAVVLDNVSGMNSLSWSRELVRGVWWQVLWRFLVMGFIAWLVSLVFSFIPEIAMLSMLFIIPFTTIYTVKLYDNLRAYKGITPESTIGKDRGLLLGLTIFGAVAVPLIIAFMVFMMVSFMF